MEQTVKRFMQRKGKGEKRGGGARGGRIDPDTNGDCLIDDNEARAAAQKRIEMVKKHIAKLKERFEARGDGRFPPMLATVDTNQDWEISADEETAAIERMAEESKARNAVVLKYYDEDGDGTLSAGEQAAAKKAMEFAEEGLRNAAKRRLGNRQRNRQGRRGGGGQR